FAIDFLFLSLTFSFCLSAHRCTSGFYTLSLHDALPICRSHAGWLTALFGQVGTCGSGDFRPTVEVGDGAVRKFGEERADIGDFRSEEHTSELQSRENLVCRLLLEKKKKKTTDQNISQN